MTEIFDWRRGEVTRGERVSQGRSARGWSKARLAKRMRELGYLAWQVDTVAAVEAGHRDLPFDELLALTYIFSQPVAGPRFGLEGDG